MKRENIIFSAYKYAPETARASVNGQPVRIQGTAAPLQICTEKQAEAIQTIKRLNRQDTRSESRYIYAYPTEDGRNFYYITALQFKASDDIAARLYCFKALKNHLKKNPPTFTTEAGHVTPNGSTKPETVTQAARINFNKLLILKIAS